ncbi:MAG: mucoidy inhibitor MuiA family protein [Chitinophagales bacterium]|nr:mucoidy inhibitor MuiA family protein [Chitinophagales bacterium]
MKHKFYLFCLMMCYGIHAHAHYAVVANNAKTLASTISDVTVFLQGAQVTRKAITTLELGTTELLLDGISPSIDKASIQVKGEGNFTILAVQHQINYLNEQAPNSSIERVSQLRDNIVRKHNQIKVQLAVLENNQELLQKNQVVGGANSGMRATDLRELLQLQRQEMTETQNKILDVRAELKIMQDSLARTERQLSELRAPNSRPTSEIRIQVAATAATTAHFIVTYLVKQASWFATYDIRAKDIVSPIQLQYKANVQQQSGEDWKNVQLKLSTGNPALGGSKPELSPWLLRFGNSYTGSRYQSAVYYSYNTNNGKNGGTIEGYVKDAKTQEPIPFANVTTLINGSQASAQADFDGFYSMKPIPEGNHTLRISFVGYAKQEIADIITYNNSTTHVDVFLQDEEVILNEVQITAYKTPILQADETATGGTITKEEIQNLPTRNVGSIASQTAGVYDKEGNVVKASRSSSQDYYIDGAKVRAGSAAPANKVIGSNADINDTPTNIEFNIQLPYTVPNDGKTYTVDVVQYEVPASYRYYCTPKLDKDAFLTAEIQEWESLNLLNGEANLFFEGTFVGKSQLNPRQTDDTLFLSLGRDKSIVVTRTKQKDYNKQTFLGSNRTETRAFDLHVRNTKKQNIDLTIEDQYPISTDKDMDIDVETDREAERNETTGLVKWKLNVPPNQEKKLLLRYSVKYPRNKHLVLE